ncbi:MAG: conjugal transfer protein TraF [Candidatus Nomurabacteria bacterium]|nr:conjugal transfer protein TraF [Candidatus Nomurabacteria bacterium]
MPSTVSENRNHLLFFYGSDCSHCDEMEPVCEKLKTETGIELEKIEVDHSDENAKMMESLDKEPCGGVPFFVNTISGKTLCGEVPYEDLKNWAEGK